MSRFTRLENFQRQIHLDFHTSPLIPGLASEFDIEQFVDTMKRARVNSVTVFAKCHHGMSYYPTKVGTVHPGLGSRDLLGEMIEGLHRAGIRAPIYTTIAWEEDVATRFPHWRQLRANGSFADVNTSADGKTTLPGRWKFNNFLHPDYQDYIEAHTREIFDRYEVDGIWYDIVFFHPDADWSEHAIRFKEKHGLTGTDAATRDRFETAGQVAFAEKFTRLVRGLSPDATVFYNAPNPLFADSTQGTRPRMAHQTHMEIESLPSGFWGYFHFPRLARMMMNTNQFWVGMTGRFQRQWGDFGGIKPQPALEYECFRSQALGGGNSIGDQLPPRGQLDAAAYDLIGSVYQQCEATEPFFAASTAIPQVGIVAPGFAGANMLQTDMSIEGAVQMCEETHYECVVLDDDSSFENLELLILPDSVVMTEKLRRKIEAYRKVGGKLLMSYRSGEDTSGKLAIDIPLIRGVDVTKYPTYWRCRHDFIPQMAKSDRVFYEAGVEAIGGEGTRVLADRVLPYFKRTDAAFSSHFQTPPLATVDAHPAVIAGPNWIYFADPIFREYRKTGNVAARDGWKRAMEILIGPPPFGAGLPTTILLTPRRRRTDLLLSLLHYIPIRKSIDIDMIEERSSFAGEVLKLPSKAKVVRVYGTDTTLTRADEGFILPSAKGRLLLEVTGYFG